MIGDDRPGSVEAALACRALYVQDAGDDRRGPRRTGAGLLEFSGLSRDPVLIRAPASALAAETRHLFSIMCGSTAI